MSVSQAEISSVTQTFLPAHDPDTEDFNLPDGPAIYGSFWIGSSEFALAVSAIREVVNEPSEITSVPLAPPFLKGLFNLRGMAIPIVDLRSFLELPALEHEDQQTGLGKIAIVETENKCIGILFERSGEVLNKPKSARMSFRSTDSTGKSAVIDGVLTLNDGRRMVQTVDPHKLIHLDNMPQAEVGDQRTSQRRNMSKRLSCISFQLGHTSCAIDLRFVQEVREMPEVDNASLSYGNVIGTVKLRGTVIPVVDFRGYMGSEPIFNLGEDVLKSRKLLVLKTKSGLVGLMVFSIDSIIPFFEEDVQPFAELALPRREIVKGSLTHSDAEVVVLLDHEQLLSDPDLTAPAQDWKEVNTAEASASEEVGEAGSKERKTFIVFSLDDCFAMDSDVVIEVINRPDKLLKPSFAMSFVEGIINLRGELITLINLRLLFGLDDGGNTQQKVLIFMQQGQKYAILVDSVDEIITTTADNVSKEHKNGFPATFDLATDNEVDVLHCTRQGKKNRLVMIMDGGTIVDRCKGQRTQSEPGFL